MTKLRLKLRGLGERGYKTILLVNGRPVNQKAYHGSVVELLNWDMNDIEKLYGYAQQYYYQGLEEQLKFIKKEDKRFLPFVEKIRQLAEDYRMDEIIDMLQKNMEDIS